MKIRPIDAADDAAVAALIRTVMTEFGAVGCGFSIGDPEVDAMSSAYPPPRAAFFVVEVGGGRGLRLAPGRAENLRPARSAGDDELPM